MNKDSLYQQLRGHLGYLKLSATAEALPAHLDAARDTEIGHTEFLEKLLRIQVEATEQRRWDTRMRLANFPAPWTINDFDFAAHDGLLERRDLRVESGDTIFIRLPFPASVDNVVIRLNSAEFEDQVHAGGDQASQENPRDHDASWAVPLKR